MSESFFLVAVALMFGQVAGFSQGTVRFQNRVGSLVDARVTFLDGTGVGVGFTAQLYAGREGTPVGSLTPLLPTTTFRVNSPETRGYINGVNITLDGILPFQNAVVQVRAYDGAAWETSAIRGQSEPFVILVGSSDPPADLVGLKPFHVNFVPEPSALSLVTACCGIIGLRKWRARWKHQGQDVS